jgi:hypothetical protein
VTWKGSPFIFIEDMAINNEAIWPRISAMASQYQKFRILAVVIKYSPTCGTDTVGTMAMCLRADPGSAAPVDFTEVQATPASVTSTVWQACQIVLPGEILSKLSGYVQSAVPGTGDVRLESAGRFFLAVDGTFSSPNPTQFGRLSVEYAVQLISPTLNAEQLTSTMEHRLTEGRLSYVGKRVMRPSHDPAFTFYKTLSAPVVCHMWFTGEFMPGLVPELPYVSVSNEWRSEDGRKLAICLLPAGKYNLLVNIPAGTQILHMVSTAIPGSVSFGPRALPPASLAGFLC